MNFHNQNYLSCTNAAVLHICDYQLAVDDTGHFEIFISFGSNDMFLQ